MSKNAITPVILTDDDGTGTTGTVINNSLFDQVQDAVDVALQQVVQTKSGGYTVLVTDDVVICTAALTLTLYAASGNSGRFLEVINTGIGVVVLDGNAAETIDGSATFSVQPGSRVKIRCNGSNWVTAQRMVPDRYPVTLANVDNTTTKTTIATFTIPANMFGDGDYIDLVVSALKKNNSGANRNVNWEFEIGGVTVTATLAQSWGDIATEYPNIDTLRLMRVGTAVWVHDYAQSSPSYSSGNQAVGLSVVAAAVTFTAAIVVNVKVTLAVANATLYLKPQTAAAWHFRG